MDPVKAVNSMTFVRPRVTFQCQYSKKFGHIETYFWTRKKDRQNQANFSENTENECRLFMAHSVVTNITNNVWFINTGCSNYISGIRSLFRPDESQKIEVRFGDDKKVRSEGNGTITIKTMQESKTPSQCATFSCFST